MTTEEREEWEQDMLEEARADELLEHKLTSDYDEFCDHFLEDIEELKALIAIVKAQHESYGWDFDIKDYE